MEIQKIPSSLIQQWEEEAIDQKIPYTEFRSFLKMKEKLYWQSLDAPRAEKNEIFANAARNKLTEYGNKFVVDYFLQIPVVERTCKLARYDMESLQKRLSRGFTDDTQRQTFISERDHWFLHLKERMKDLRISKETLESYGLSWKSAKSFAYQTI